MGGRQLGFTDYEQATPLKCTNRCQLLSDTVYMGTGRPRCALIKML